MIKLSLERGVISEKNSWNEIVELPGFVSKIDPNMIELETVIGSYIFKDKINCGLTSCGTPHNKGFIVKAIDGTITNVGHVCGKKNFSVNFDEMSRKFEKDVKMHDLRELLKTIKRKKDYYENEIHQLINSEKGSSWVIKTKRKFNTRNTLPVKVFECLSSMIRNKNGTIKTYREATKKEVEDIEAIERREVEKPHYIEEQVGYLKGLNIFYPENDLKEIMICNVLNPVQQIVQNDIDSMSLKELSSYSKVVEKFDANIDLAKKIIKGSREFFTKDNLSQLIQLLNNEDDIKKYRVVISKFD